MGYLLATSVALGGVLSLRGMGLSWSHPVLVGLGTWIVALPVAALPALNFPPLSPRATTLVSLGLASMTVGVYFDECVLRQTANLSHPASRLVAKEIRAHRPRLASSLSLALTGIALYGAYSYRTAISESAGPLSELTRQQLRAFSHDAAVGPSGALLALASLGIAIALVGRGIPMAVRAISGVGCALSLASQTSRSMVILSLAIPLVFYAQFQGRSATNVSPIPATSITQVRKYIPAVFGLTLGALYFIWEGARQDVVAIRDSSPVETIAVYLAGNGAALGSAIDNDLKPTAGFGRTIWILPRIFSLLGLASPPPEVVLESSGVRGGFNTYSWMGDVIFDWGYLGIPIFGIGLAWSVSYLFRRAKIGTSLIVSWCTAILFVHYVWGIIGLTVLWLQPAFLVVIGGPILMGVLRRQEVGP